MSQENSFMSEQNSLISEDNNFISEDDNFISEEKNYKDLGKWLWIIFWMTIAATVITLLLDNSIAAKFIPGNEMIDNIFGLVFLLARSVIIYKLYTVQGKPENIKITTPSDFYIFRAMVDARESSQIFGI